MIEGNPDYAGDRWKHLRRCDHCGQTLRRGVHGNDPGYMWLWPDWNQRVRGIWLHPRCEQGWWDAEAPKTPRKGRL